MFTKSLAPDSHQTANKPSTLAVGIVFAVLIVLCSNQNQSTDMLIVVRSKDIILDQIHKSKKRGGEL